MSINGTDAAKGNILVVDDSPENLRLITQILAERGYRVQAVTSGSRALAGLRSTHPDLILLDVKMPGMDGYEFCRHLKGDEETSDIPIVFISVLGKTEDKVKGFSAGGADYITKPFQIDEVIARVETQLALRNTQKQLLETNRELEKRLQELACSKEAAACNLHKMRVSEERLRQITDNMLDIVIVVDAEGAVRYVSPSHKDILGYDPESVLGWPFLERVHPDDMDRVMTVIDTALSIGASGKVEVRARHADGSYVWLETIGSAIYDDTSQLRGAIFNARDITERVRTDEVLQRRNRELALLSRATALAASAVDLADALQKVCAELAEYLQVPQAGFAILNSERTAAQVIADYHPPDSASALGLFIPVAGNPSMTYILEHNAPLAVADAQTDPVLAPVHEIMRQRNVRSILIVPILVEGELMGTLGFDAFERRVFGQADVELVQQVANQMGQMLMRRQTEEELRKVTQELRAIFQAQPDVFFHLKRDGTIADYYAGCESDLFLPSEEFLGKRMQEVLPPEVGQSFDRGLNETREKNDLVTVEYMLQMPSGYKTFEARLLPFMEGDVVAVVRDVTERVRAESQRDAMLEALRQRNRDLELLNRAGEVFNSTLEVHDVLSTVLEEVRQMFGAAGCSAWLIDPETDELVCWQEAGSASEIVRGWRLAPGQGIAGWVANRDESLIVQDTQTDPRYFQGVDEQAGLGLRSILAVPLRVKGDVIGVLEVVDDVVGRFTTADLMLVESLASTVATAIENARLYGQARQDAETKAVLLREVNHRVKNNLAAIIGLLYAEQGRVGMERGPDGQTLMKDLINRVHGLATVHGMLSASEWAPLPLDELTRKIIRAAFQMLPHNKHLSIDVSRTSIQVTPSQAGSLALVINELTTNTVKYALGERQSACITVRTSLEDGSIIFEYRDDGPGYPEDVLRLGRCKVGLGLIKEIVADELDGELTLSNDQGAVALFRFRAWAQDSGKTSEALWPG